MTRCLFALLVILALSACADKKPTTPTTLTWETDEQTALASARSDNKRILVDFGALWCAPCLEYEKKTFVDPAVIEALTGWVLLRLDVTELSDASKALMQRYQVDVLPAILVLDSSGAEVGRITEFLPPAPFLARLRELPTRE